MRPGDVSRAEIVAALSIATDMAMGRRLESGLRICPTALTLAEEAGLGDDERARVFHVAPLRHAGRGCPPSWGRCASTARGR